MVFYQVRALTDNFAATNNFIGSLLDNGSDESLVDQRLRFTVSSTLNKYANFTYTGEIDMQFGDESYSNSGRNDGGAIGGDTTNLESKNLYVDINLPDFATSIRTGLQGLDDHYNYTLFSADMAGVKVSTQLNGTRLTAGWFKLIEGDFNASDDITLWSLQAELIETDNLKIGADYYYYQNEGMGQASATSYGWVDSDNDPSTAPVWDTLATTYRQEYASYFGTADIGALGGAGSNWSQTRSNMDLHYLGVHGEYKIGQVILTGWLNANAGSVDDLTINGNLEDVDVEGYAASLKATTTINKIKLSMRGTYFSGDDNLSDGDAKFIVNPMAIESFAFGGDGFMIFTPDGNWTSVGQYGFAMVDAAYAGYGLAAVNLTAHYKPTDKTYIHSGIGYFSSLEDTTKDDRTNRSGTNLGTEIFLRTGYSFTENIEVSLHGAYAWLGDFYDNNGGGTAINSSSSDIENPYEAYAMLKVTF